MVGYTGSDFEIRFDERALTRVERMAGSISPTATRRIIPPSLNRTARYVRTHMGRAIRQQVSLKAAEANRWFAMTYATGTRWSARAEVRSTIQVPVAWFAGGQESGGVSYQLPSGRSGSIPHAFWATTRQGHRAVFLRGRYAKSGSFEQGSIRQHRKRVRKFSAAGKFMWPELPIYEKKLNVLREEVLNTSFMPPVRVAAAGQLVKEIASRLKWELQKARTR